MKKMKMRYWGWVLAGVLILTVSCSDWLDVNPRTEMKENDIYTSEKGFQNIMNGIYIQLASKELYGVNMSFYFPDLLAGLWSPTSNTTEKYIAAFDYKQTNVEKTITDIWGKYYKCIAHINILLENLDKTEVRFSYGNKELLKGEAYGLRAFLHLEILRLFGPVPREAAGAHEAIPYVTELTKNPSRLVSVSYDQVQKMILQDLDSAEMYLKNDPFTLGSMYDLNNPHSYQINYVPDDDWHYYRQTHLNLYAVDAVRARFYQWIGNTQEANRYARKVLAAANPDGTEKFVLANEANTYTANFGKNLVMQCEHLFAVNCSDHQEKLLQVLTGIGTNRPKIYLMSRYLQTIYEKEESDIRNRSGRYFERDGQYAYCLKYSGSGLIEPINMIPLIRLAEMYLILIENLPWQEAQEYFNTYRQARGMGVNIGFNSDSEKLQWVEKEYRKEFYAEGQMFYYYKRHNIQTWTIPARVTVPQDGFVVPKPKGQTAFE